MAIEEIRVSDFSGQQITNPDEQLVSVIVTDHPDLDPDQHAELDGTPEELASLGKAALAAVGLKVVFPGAEQPQRVFLTPSNFNKLFTGGQASEDVVAAAAVTEVVKQRTARRSSHNTTVNGEDLKNWSDPVRAGLPHQGTVARGEAEYVRTHLDEVNARRTAAGHRPIDPTNPTDAKKYEFTSQDQPSAEAPAADQK